MKNNKVNEKRNNDKGKLIIIIITKIYNVKKNKKEKSNNDKENIAIRKIYNVI